MTERSDIRGNSLLVVASPIEFRKLPLSLTTRRRLGAIDDSRHGHPRQKMVLADKLLSCAYDPMRGLYIPLVSHKRVPGKITEDFGKVPRQLSASEGTPYSLFCNALLLPTTSFEMEGDLPSLVKPMLRITNPGFVVVTIEHDPTCQPDFEESIKWTSQGGKLYELDKQLRTYKDYDGFCAVWSGNKSVHLHFVFDTTHFVDAQFELSASQRWASYAQHTAVMATVHRRYFDHLVRLSSEILRPSVQADMNLRSHSQYRRMPWGLRRLEKDSDITGLKAGMVVPQLVLAENIRIGRAAKGSNKYLVSSDVTGDQASASVPYRSTHVQQTGLGDEIVNELARFCWSEWRQEFPKPVSVRQEEGEWVINFSNHNGDQTPSTVCRGNHSTLLFQGHGAPQGSFELPGGLTANEFGDYLGLQFGLIKLGQLVSLNDQETETNYFARLKQQTGRPFKDSFEEGLRRNFPQRSSGSIAELQGAYRDKMRAACADVRAFNSHAIMLSAEGIGKTRALFEIMANEALDTALGPDDNQVKFNAFAFRSEQQAVEKRREYERETGRSAFLWRSFWSHYADACHWVNLKPIPKAEFANETNILAVVNQVRREQPVVFGRLEEVRRTMWVNDAGQSSFNSNTVLFTTHATVMSWDEGHATRSWHHPDFGQSITTDEVELLRNRTALQDVIFDEPEFGELIWLLTADLYAHLVGVKQHDWKGRTVVERRKLYSAIRSSGDIPSDLSFEAYSELRYLDLSTLQRVEVDFEAQPFGLENSPESIYRIWHQRPFYLGVKRWPFASSARITYLTTEAFTTETIAAVYQKAATPLFKLELDYLPPLYPIYVSVAKDKRARAQTIQELAQEILASNDNAVVIADGLREAKGERALTFQSMKGHNGLSEKDVFIIVTFLAPAVYAELNVLGQWTGQLDTVAKYYAAQISQAVGRNTGFRQKLGTKTVVVATNKLLRLIQPKLARFAPRVRLEVSPETFW
jgi:hypothetical protein